MTENDNGKRDAAPPTSPPPQINPGDIAAQVAVVRTKQGGSFLVFPKTPEGTPDLSLTLELMIEGLTMLGQMMRQQTPQDAKRIVLVPGLPPGVDLRGRAGK